MWYIKKNCHRLTFTRHWIQIYDAKSKRQSTVWVFKINIPHSKLVTFQRKQLPIFLFRNNGNMATVHKEKIVTVNSNYTNLFLPEVSGQIRKNHVSKNHFSSRQSDCQKSARPATYLIGETIQLNSLLSAVLIRQPGTSFGTYLYLECYKKWFEQLYKSCDHHGEYFEKQ